MTYRPYPDSLAGRVLGFFALNPDEELTFEDIVAKFVDQGDHRNVHARLIGALDHDMLTFDPHEDMYRKGPVDMPLIRGIDSGDDSTGDDVAPKLPANRKSSRSTADAFQAAMLGEEPAKKVATRSPPPHQGGAHTDKALSAMETVAERAFNPQQAAPSPAAGDADEMDRTGKGTDPSALPDTDSTSAGGEAGADGQGCAPEGTRAEGDEDSARAKELAAHRFGEVGQGSPHTQGHRHGPAKEGLEAGGCAGLGGDSWSDPGRDGTTDARAWPSTGIGESVIGAQREPIGSPGDGHGSPAWRRTDEGRRSTEEGCANVRQENQLEEGGHDPLGISPRANSARQSTDGHRQQQAAHAGQPGLVHAGGTHDPRLGEQQPPRGGRAVPAQGADQQASEIDGAQSGIGAVRHHLMETLRALRDPANPMPLDRAKVVAEVAAVLVNSAKVEVDYLKVTQQRRGQFFEALPALEEGS